MKKLFVLFLLVALVPFTVGCSLWGGDDEPVTYPPILTAKVIVPAAGLSLRAAAADVAGTNWAGYKISLNGVELPAILWEAVAGGVELTFQDMVSQAQKDAVEKATAPIVVVLTGETLVSTFTINPTGLTGALVITVNAAGAVTAVTIGGTAVDAEYIGKETFVITTVKVGETTIGKVSTTPAVVTTLLPTFAVTFDEAVGDFNAATFVVTAKSVNGAAAQELAASMFTVTAGADANSINVAVKQSTVNQLVDGKTYQVNIVTAKNAAGNVVVPATYYFMVTLP